MRVVTARQMRRIDRLAQERFGIPELLLMEHAGSAVARRAGVLFLKQKKRSGPILVLAGAGANGGDGFVAARHLDNGGFPIRVILLANPSRLAGSARLNFQILKHLKVPVVFLSTITRWRQWAGKAFPIRMAIDALLGTGLSGSVREPIASAIQWLNRQNFPILSVDIPSGLSAESGRPSPVAVRATETLTCGMLKRGLLTPSGRLWCGRIQVIDIGLPRKLKGR